MNKKRFEKVLEVIDDFTPTTHIDMGYWDKCVIGKCSRNDFFIKEGLQLEECMKGYEEAYNYLADFFGISYLDAWHTFGGSCDVEDTIREITCLLSKE